MIRASSWRWLDVVAGISVHFFQNLFLSCFAVKITNLRSLGGQWIFFSREYQCIRLNTSGNIEIQGKQSTFSKISFWKLSVPSVFLPFNYWITELSWMVHTVIAHLPETFPSKSQHYSLLSKRFQNFGLIWKLVCPGLNIKLYCMFTTNISLTWTFLIIAIKKQTANNS